MRGDHVESADGARSEDLLGLDVNERADSLAADLEDAPGGFGTVDHGRAVLVEVDHRLFAVHILAGLHGVDGGLLVPMVGGADDDRIDVLAGENVVVVAGGEDVVAPQFLAAGKAAVIAVRRGHEFDPWDLDGGAGVVLPLPSGSDKGDLDMVIGGDRLGRLLFGFGCGKKMQTRHQGGCRSGGGSAQKTPAVDSEHEGPPRR